MRKLPRPKKLCSTNCKPNYIYKIPNKKNKLQCPIANRIALRPEILGDTLAYPPCLQRREYINSLLLQTAHTEEIPW